MRTILPLLALCCLAPAAPAQNAEPVSSPRTQQAVRDRLPKYNPAASDAARKAAAEAKARQKVETSTKKVNEQGEEVVVLPDFQVLDRKVAQPDPDQWLSREELAKKAMRNYAAKQNDLELALNRWHIPLLSPSFASRAMADYEAEKRREETERLEHLNKIGELGGGKP
ncbi:MAG: hypothetical protein NDI75_05380 [Candidatus Didemnitutus sp.]|nr:hypothetical protein [Candidatus Didemnitutus sp.]